MAPAHALVNAHRHDKLVTLLGLIFLQLLIILSAKSLVAVAAVFVVAAFGFLLAYRKSVALACIMLAVPFSWSRLAQITVGPMEVKLCYVLTATAAAYLLYRHFRKRSAMHFDATFIWLIIFIAFAVLSVIFSIDIKWSVKEFVQLALFVVTAFAASNLIATRKDLQWFVGALMVICAVMSVYGIATIGLSNHFTSDGEAIKRATIGFRDANLGANFALLGFAASLVYYFAPKGQPLRKLALICLPIISVGLLATYSRAGWVTAIVMVVLVSLLLGKWKSGAKTILVVAVAAAVIGGQTVIERAGEITSSKESSTVSHLYYWKTAAYLAVNHPLTGIGVGAFPKYFEMYGGTSMVPEPTILGSRAWVGSSRGNPQLAHNVILQMWSEIGTPGLAAFLIAVAVVWRRLLRRARQIDDIDLKLTMLALFAASFAVLFHNLSITNLVDHFWILLGACIAAIRIAAAQKTPEKQNVITPAV